MPEPAARQARRPRPSPAGGPSMLREAVKAAAGALPDVPIPTVEQVALAVLRVALPLHETQHAAAWRAAHERAVHFEWEAVRATERAEKAAAELAEVRAEMADPFNRDRIAAAVQRARRQRDEAVEAAEAELEEYKADLKAANVELERLRAKVAGLDDCLTATAVAKGSNRYAGQGRLITLLTVDDVREMISEWREGGDGDGQR